MKNEDEKMMKTRRTYRMKNKPRSESTLRNWLKSSPMMKNAWTLGNLCSVTTIRTNNTSGDVLKDRVDKTELVKEECPGETEIKGRETAIFRRKL